jgi:phosphoribosylanthranilate isomerase
MTTRVKICGITRADDATLAVAMGAAAIGFVFWPESPRAIAPSAARAISDALPPFVTRVGVFVDASPSEVRAIVAQAGLDVAQLHGDERAIDYAGVGARLLKTVTLEDDAALERARAQPEAVTLLVDAADRQRRGGTGQRANWDRARQLAGLRPIILAGGLGAANIGEALAQVEPAAIDVSSGVESAPGVKSRDRLAAFFEALMAYERRGGSAS